MTKKLGMGEFHRSLQTADPRIARRRAAGVTQWWGELVERLRQMPAPTRADLQAAADAFFKKLMADVDVPRDFPDDHFDEAVDENVEVSRARLDALEDQLRSNKFDGQVEHSASRIARKAGGTLEQLDPHSRLFALQLAANAEREQMRFAVHALTNPGVPFAPTMAQGDPPAAPAVGVTPTAGPSSMTLRAAIDGYLQRRKLDKIGTSHTQEMVRALDWLVDHLGADRPLYAISRDDALAFRNGVERLDTRWRGKTAGFAVRQTDDPDFQINPRTAERYWATVLAFFEWTSEEVRTGHDPAKGLKTRAPRGNAKRTPPPFTKEELKRLFHTPLYAGHKSRTFLLAPGNDLSRGSYWWSGVIALHTGMRAGEIAQLQIADFAFGTDVAVIHVQADGDDPEVSQPKKLKSLAAARDVPISTVLIDLGLEEFVAKMAKGAGRPRVFPDLGFGKGDRRSDALTKFWSRHLRQYGLHEPGRATHVFRHTFVAALRRAEVPEELIGSIVGHAPTSQTGAYGGAFPTSLKADAIAKINYGFDLVALLRTHEAALASGKRAAPTPAEQAEAEITIIEPVGLADHDDDEQVVD